MPEIKCTHVEVYPFRRTGLGAEFLALRRSEGRSLAGVWQPVTGKIEQGETAVQAAVRELHEETGFTTTTWWGLETMSTFFEWSKDEVRTLPLFAAEIESEDVRLSPEHDAFKFVDLGEAEKLFLWSAQAAGVRAVRDEIISGGALAEALTIPPDRIPTP